jgi:hypothetical protein
MKTFTIGGKTFEFDDSKTYRDYTVERTPAGLVGRLETVALGRMFADLESGRLPFGPPFLLHLHLLSRWKTDAPRKRTYRNVILGQRRGDPEFTKLPRVLSDEQFFLDEGGDKIIDDLESTGQVATQFLSLFGLPSYEHPKQKTSIWVGTGDEMRMVVPPT